MRSGLNFLVWKGEEGVEMWEEYIESDLNNYVVVDVATLCETKQAVLFTDREKEFWVPKSVMIRWPEVGYVGIAEIAEWFAVKEGLV